MSDDPGQTAPVEEQAVVAELTLEQLHDIPSDPEEEKKVRRGMQLEKGTYNSVPELLVKGYPSKKIEGRVMWKYFGQFVGTGDVAGQRGYASFWISETPGYQEKNPGKVDGMTKLFAQAKVTYRKAMGLEKDAVVSNKAVLIYLQKYSVAVNFSPSDGDDPFVNAISTAREV